MNMRIAKTAAAAVAMTAALSLSACKVDKTQEGEMPEVDVQAKGGQLPKYDVETPEVKMGTETRTIEVPTATVEMPDDPDSKVTDEVDSSEQ
jgi:hypothetical protein